MSIDRPVRVLACVAVILALITFCSPALPAEELGDEHEPSVSPTLAPRPAMPRFPITGDPRP
jgi:hypothetical protein